MSARFQACCNLVTYGCGCASWLQAEGGRWVPKSWTCYGHESREVSASA